jgi:cell division septation protein DedD
MATSQINISEDQGELSDIKRKLAWRMGFAILMIVGLLGGLAVFDYLSNQPVDASANAPQFTEPVPVAKKTVTQPLTPAEPLPEVKEIKEAVIPEATTAPVDKTAPKLDLPPRPEIAAHPVLPRASQPANRVVGQVNTPAAAVSSPRPLESRAPAANSAPSRQEAEAPPPPVRLYSGFALQAGVFADPRRAEELHAKLILEGIPSTIEARVQVGPFKTREEAEAARAKMKALGIDAVMLPSRGAKR